MKKLYLMRHGHSPTSAEAGVKTDAQRPLSDKGRADARRVAEALIKRGARPALILHSPLLRAVQTAAAAAAALKCPAESFVPLDNTLHPQDVIAALRERAADFDEVLAIGHQPQIGEVAALLTGETFEFRPAGLVAVEDGSAPRALWSLGAEEAG